MIAAGKLAMVAFGLWATGCMTWQRTRHTHRVGLEWLHEQTVWTYQDQLSWPVVVRRNDIDVRHLPGSLWDHQMLSFRPHASHL